VRSLISEFARPKYIWPHLDSNIVHRFGHIICSWILGRRDLVLADDEKEWVELGFARFRDPKDFSSERVVVNEPLIILAAAHHLATDTVGGLVDHVLKGLGPSAGRGTRFEEFVAVYLAQAFGPDVRLCDVFDFGKDIPIWAQSKGVQLVALSSDGNRYIVNHSVDGPVGTSSPLSCTLKDASETVEWFRNPHMVMCFPDKYLGSDLVFFVDLPD
jgi:hypothetical protein